MAASLVAISVLVASSALAVSTLVAVPVLLPVPLVGVVSMAVVFVLPGLALALTLASRVAGRAGVDVVPVALPPPRPGAAADRRRRGWRCGRWPCRRGGWRWRRLRGRLGWRWRRLRAAAARRLWLLLRPRVARPAGTCRPAAVRRRSRGICADERDRLRPARIRGRVLRRRRSELRLLGPECLLPRDSCSFRAQARQRVEQVGARLEVDRRRHRDQNLLRRVVVERGTPQVSGTHRSRDKCRQPDRMRRQHGQQSAVRIGRRLGRVPACELDAVLAVLLRAVQRAVRGPQERVDGLRLAQLRDAEAGGHHHLLPHAQRNLQLGQR